MMICIFIFLVWTLVCVDAFHGYTPRILRTAVKGLRTPVSSSTNIMKSNNFVMKETILSSLSSSTLEENLTRSNEIKPSSLPALVLHYSSHSTSFFVSKLKSFAASRHKDIQDVPSILTPCIIDILGKEDVSHSMVCDLLWSCARLGYKLSTHSHRPVCMQLIDKFLELQPTNAKDYTEGLSGICKLGAKWHLLSNVLREQFQTSVQQALTSPTIDPRGVATILYRFNIYFSHIVTYSLLFYFLSCFIM